MHWLDHGDEHSLVNDAGDQLARVFKVGCCWYAMLTGAASSGRFKYLIEAKQIAEQLVRLSATRALTN